MLIDVDALAAADDENWVWAGAKVIEPDYSLALISLSRGGSDAAVVREFDMRTGEFVADGFEVPEAKTQISWEDEDTVLIGTDFGEGSLTESGYPRLVKRWRRGTPLDDAETLFSGSSTDVIVAASRDRTPGFERTHAEPRRSTSSTTRSTSCATASSIRIDAPTDATVSVHRNWLLIELRTDWYVGPDHLSAGSLIAADYDEFLAGTADLHVVFEPDDHTSLHHYAWTRDKLVIVTLADVASRVQTVTPGSWTAEPVPGIPDNTNTVIVDTDELGDEIFLDFSGFDTPSRLLHGPVEGPLEQIKSAPAFFDAEDITVTQHFATSKDGTAIPYFVVGHRDTTGPAPTLLGGYGGFEVSRTPGYDGVLGRLWLARGGTYVLANIRGGGEYGPRLAHPGDARRPAPGGRGFRRGRRGFGAARHHHGRAARRTGRQQRRPADGRHVDPIPGAVRCAGVQRAAAGHAALPPAAGRRLVGGRIRRPGRSRRLGVHRRSTRRTRTSRPTAAIRRC